MSDRWVHNCDYIRLGIRGDSQTRSFGGWISACPHCGKANHSPAPKTAKPTPATGGGVGGMNHLIDKIEAYARHYQLEQAGMTNQADARFSSVYDALSAHTEAVSRSSVVAYREGLAGVPFNPGYQPWEVEAWNSGKADRK